MKKKRLGLFRDVGIYTKKRRELLAALWCAAVGVRGAKKSG